MENAEITAIEEKPKDVYAPSRGAYIIGSFLNYFIHIATSGTFLAKLTTTAGIPDSTTAILSSFTTFAGMFQLISIFLAHKTPVKRWVVPIQFISNVMLACLYLLPIFDLGRYSAIIFFVVIVVTKAGISIITPSRVNWFFAITEESKRGVFVAKNNMISFGTGIAFTYLMGILIDSFEAKGDLTGAFTVLVIVILVISFLELAVMLIAKEKPERKEKAPSHLADIKDLFTSRKYRRMLLLYSLWQCALNVTMPFLGTYQINELGFSMTVVATITSVTSILNMAMLPLFGKYSVRHSYASMIRRSYPVAIVAYIALALSGNGVMLIFYFVYLLLRVIYGELHTVADLNLIYGAVPENQRTAALAMNTMMVGLCSFVTTLAVSPLVDLIQKNGLSLFGREIYAQQVLALISTLLLVAVALFYHFGCKKLLETESEAEIQV